MVYLLPNCVFEPEIKSECTDCSDDGIPPQLSKLGPFRWFRPYDQGLLQAAFTPLFSSAILDYL